MIYARGALKSPEVEPFCLMVEKKIAEKLHRGDQESWMVVISAMDHLADG